MVTVSVSLMKCLNLLKYSYVCPSVLRVQDRLQGDISTNSMAVR